MNKLKTLVVAGAAAATMAVGVMPANAAGTWTVSAGAASNGTTVNITGKTTGATPQIGFTTNTGLQLGCDAGTAPGKTKVGSGQLGAAIGTITAPATTWKNCVGPLGLQLSVAGIGTWKINAKTYASGVTTGTISAVKANVTGSGCSFTVTGQPAITYTNSTQILAVPGTSFDLTISNVNGCFGAISNGDTAKFKANYKLKGKPLANNPIQITKP